MKTNSPDSQETLSFFGRLKRFVRAVAVRALVHFIALFLAAGVSLSRWPDFVSLGLSKGHVQLIIYVGVVCLVPRGMGWNAAWLIPTGAGVVQYVSLLALGVSFPLVVLWAGAQTWVQRLIRQRGAMGWEWAALPWLFLCLVNTPLPDVSSYASVGVVTLLGWMAQFLYGRTSVRLIETYLTRLRKILNAGVLPLPLQTPVQNLLTCCMRLAKEKKNLDRKAVARVADRVRDAVDALESLTKNGRPAAWDLRINGLYRQINTLVRALRKELGDQLLPDPQTPAKATATDPLPAQETPLPPDDDMEARLHWYGESAARLVIKTKTLPETLRMPAGSICRETEKILTCMRTDPQDVMQGDLFLSRYLVATHRIIDEYIRLSREGVGHEAVAQVLAKSTDLLQRLEQAFVNEHGMLLKNDTFNLSVELDVLERMLKIEGR